MEIPAIEKNTVVRAPQAGFQEQFASSSVDVVFGGGILASGKAQLLDSHVVTPLGLRRIGDLEVGDIISNPDTGGQERITIVHPIEKHPYYRVSFTDGTFTDCSEGHLWKARDINFKNPILHWEDWRIWDTKTLYALFSSGGGRHRMEIPTCVAPEIYSNTSLTPGVKTYIKQIVESCSDIPQPYIYGSIQIRKAIFDEVFNFNLRSETMYDEYMFVRTDNENFARGVATVYRSLGGIAAVVDGGCHIYYEGARKEIASVVCLGVREGRCITVDNPSGLYITDDFVVTHNSYGLVLALAEPLMTDPDFRALISRRSLGSVKSGGGFVDKFREIFGEYCEIRQADSPRVSFDCGAYCDLTYIDDSNIEKMRERVKGWEYDVIAIDELTEMSWEAFSYIQTRNRGRSKTFTGKFFATMNPKKSHWVRTFIDWYINPQGYIDPERDGKVRYFYIAGSSVKEVIWGNSKLDVYQKCKASIDRKMASVGGNFTYENFIKSFVFYQGHLAENKGLIGDNPDYVGSVSASGGAMSEALLEGNWNVDPDNEEERAIPMPSARLVFTEDPAVNGDLWVTVDLADYGTDNVVALAWNGFHIIGIMMLGHTRPAENANAVQSFALKYGVGRSHIIYDATAARYFNDYIPEAVPYLSSSKSRGMYKYDAMTLKDNCYLRLCKMIRSGCITMDDGVANSTYTHENLKHKITVEQEFMQECAVVHFNEFVSGKKRLDTKREMNRRLGNGRSMDLLDPCAMRMLPCCDLEYGAELEDGYETTFRTKNLVPVQESVFDETVWY